MGLGMVEKDPVGPMSVGVAQSRCSVSPQRLQEKTKGRRKHRHFREEMSQVQPGSPHPLWSCLLSRPVSGAKFFYIKARSQPMSFLTSVTLPKGVSESK